MSAKSPAADRLRPTAWDALIVLCVVAAAAALFLALRPGTGNHLTAEIVLDGETVARYRLDRLTGPERLEVDGPYPLVIEAEPGRIRVAESACPGGDCVHTGWAERAGQRIICLPNRLVISLTGDTQQDFDAVTG